MGFHVYGDRAMSASIAANPGRSAQAKDVTLIVMAVVYEMRTALQDHSPQTSGSSLWQGGAIDILWLPLFIK